MATIEELILSLLGAAPPTGLAHADLLGRVQAELGCSRSLIEVALADFEGEGRIRRAAIAAPWKLTSRIDEERP
jgi:hypothetical protein